MNAAAEYDVLEMVLSAVSLVGTAITWAALTVMTSFNRKG